MHRRMPEQSTEVEIPKKVMVAAYSALLALGLIIYFTWGLIYNSWNIFERSNLGIYSVTMVLCGFGFFGLLLYSIKGNKQ
jgi:hypothetical protein